MARPRPSRLSGGRILRDLRVAARRGDRAALTLAVDQMRTLALSPRYWEKYLVLLRNPLARLVDLLVIKQGDRIAQQKGWKKGGGRPRPNAPARPSRSRPAPPAKRRPRRPAVGPEQGQLFEL
ncbi:MAG TPA: hypothetical protein VLG10_00830 [Methylomirabilota bacterium]|nr:hypothetical protein [Methylomirabilota bacterium]